MAILLNGGADGTNTCDDLSRKKPLKPSWSDIQSGTSLIVRDGTGSIVGKGSLTAKPAVDLGENSAIDCQYSFAVPDLRRADFYSISIGSHDGPTYSLAEIEQANWTIALSGD